MRICVPIQAETVTEATVFMKRAFRIADMVELRIDGMEHPDLPHLLRDRAGEILVTNRCREEGGAYRGTESERAGLLIEAIALGADYVDIEAATRPELIARLKEQITAGRGRTQLILSRHDFNGTPSGQTLQRWFRDMAAMGGDIIKIVTYARAMEDNLKMLSLISYARRRNFKIIALCMGPLGRPSRVFATMGGAYLTYAALEEGAESAPGQLTVDQMKKIWDILAL